MGSASGAGSAIVAIGEEARLIMVNTTATLIQYDPFSLSAEVSKGLDYQVAITSATA